MLPEETANHLHALVRLFLEENSRINLSAFRTGEDCWHGNVLDSLAALELPLFREQDGLRILDVGTGGGFPLLPLAVCLPQHTFTGLDSTQKKVDAVQRIADGLALPNVSLLAGRAEELGRDPAHREQYDAVTARALAPLNTLLEYASPFVRPGGHIVCWKSLQTEQELQDSLLARAELSCHLTDRHRYSLPGKWGERQLLVFGKRTPLHDKYPRGTGTPKKHPLL